MFTLHKPYIQLYLCIRLLTCFHDDDHMHVMMYIMFVWIPPCFYNNNHRFILSLYFFVHDILGVEIQVHATGKRLHESEGIRSDRIICTYALM